MNERVKARRGKLEGFCRDDGTCPKGKVFSSENCSDCFFASDILSKYGLTLEERQTLWNKPFNL